MARGRARAAAKFYRKALRVYAASSGGRDMGSGREEDGWRLDACSHLHQALFISEGGESARGNVSKTHTHTHTHTAPDQFEKSYLKHL